MFKNIALLRQQLHQHPEISGKEVKTAAFVTQILHNLAPSNLITGVGGTGVLATFDSGLPGPAVLFRAELDALPIQETNIFPYTSTFPGVSHKCGHDGHMSILLGLAYWIYTHPPAQGKILLLFQPAEETGAGANAVLRDPRLNDLHLDFVFALHNLPGHAKHEILLKTGVFTAAVKSIIIKLHGKTAHAAEPEHGINPATAIAELITGAQDLVVPDATRANFTLLTPIYINMGEKAYGVSAGYGEVHFTLRTWTEANMQHLTDHLLSLINQVSSKHKLKVETSWTDTFTANENNIQAVDLIRHAAKRLGLSIHEMDTPIKWGEDFGLFTQRFPGALFGLGAGKNTPALHNPDYDFPDELIPTGVDVFSGILRQLLY